MSIVDDVVAPGKVVVVSLNVPEQRHLHYELVLLPFCISMIVLSRWVVGFIEVDPLALSRSYALIGLHELPHSFFLLVEVSGLVSVL